MAQVEAVNGYVRPVIDKGDAIVIRAGRHPVVEQTLADGERFVPNDARLSTDERLIVLTGPNMSGKSVYVRQVALIALLAQIGSFVPAPASPCAICLISSQHAAAFSNREGARQN